VAGKGQPNATTPADRERRAAQRATRPTRATRAQVLAGVRADSPNEGITRNHPTFRAEYTHAVMMWRRRNDARGLARRVGA
jgi:hypothetical protein